MPTSCKDILFVIVVGRDYYNRFSRCFLEQGSMEQERKYMERLPWLIKYISFYNQNRITDNSEVFY